MSALPPISRLLLFALALLPATTSSLLAQDAESIFQSANGDFEKGNFEQSSLKYFRLAENGLVSPDLFYNLGTSKFKEGKPGEAMLWLRRALVLDSTLPEAKQNIEFLRTRLAFLEFSTSRIDQFIRGLPSGFGRWFGSVFLWLALLSLVIGFTVPRLKPNRSGLIVVALISLLLAVVAFRVGQYRSTRLAPENFATVTALNAVALTAPAPDAKSVIDLPPGSEVRILQISGPWRYVDIPGELRGWIRAESVKTVWPATSSLHMKLLFLCLSLASTTLLQAAPEERIVIGAEARKGIAIVDPSDKNKVLWHHPIGPVHDLHLLPNYHLLTQDGWTNLIELDLTGKCVWNYAALEQNREGARNDIEIHAYQPLDDGNLMFVESGASRLLVITPEGNLVKQFPLAVSKPSVHSDTRRVRRLDNGHYLVAHEADQIVKEYSAEGRVLWEFPIPLFGREPKKGHGPEGFGGRCFAAIQAKNGNYLITTGNGHSVLEVTPKKEIVWKLEQNDLKGITLAWVTTIEERENGNLMIGNCHAGPDNPQIIEVTRNKEVAWSFHDFETFGNALSTSLVIDGERARELRKRLASH